MHIVCVLVLSVIKLDGYKDDRVCSDQNSLALLGFLVLLCAFEHEVKNQSNKTMMQIESYESFLLLTTKKEQIVCLINL